MSSAAAVATHGQPQASFWRKLFRPFDKSIAKEPKVYKGWTVTLESLYQRRPPPEAWLDLLRKLDKTGPDETEVTVEQILDLAGFDAAIFALGAVSGHDSEIRLLAVSYAEDVLHLTREPRCFDVLDLARRHAQGQATDKELARARERVFLFESREWTREAAWATTIESARLAAQEAAWAAGEAVEQAAKQASYYYVKQRGGDVCERARVSIRAGGSASASLQREQTDRFRAMVRGEWPEQTQKEES
jgi:hypothetical protein